MKKKQPKTLYPAKKKEIRISKAMLVLMAIMTILMFYICCVITIQSIYCIPMA